MGVLNRFLLLFILVMASGAYAGERLAPAIALQDVQGVEKKHVYPNGKVTMVHFWATWCPPCRKELPQLLQLSEKLKAKGLTLLLVAADNRDDTAEYVIRHRLPVSALVDQYGKAMHDYHVQGLPTTVFVDRKGKVVGQRRGMVEWLEPDNLAQVERLLEN